MAFILTYCPFKEVKIKINVESLFTLLKQSVGLYLVWLPWWFLIVASRMRGMVASVPFEQFHKYSTDIVRTAVFGKDKEGKLKSVLKFPANNLVSVHPF